LTKIIRTFLKKQCVFVFFSLLALLIFSFVTVSGQSSSGGIIVANFDVPVDPGSSAFMTRVFSQAAQRGAAAVIIEMNTPGGLLSDMLSIVSSINGSSIPTYTFIVPNGLGASAGSYIAMASTKIFMGPGSAIGPSTPIVVGGSQLEQNHTQAAMLALMQSLAERWGRSKNATYNMVQSDQAYSASDAYANHVVDGLADSLNQVINMTGLTGQPQTVLSESLYESFLSALSNPTLDGILILLGIVIIVLDFYHPTIILTVAGVIAIVMGLIGAEIISASWLGFIILAIAAVLIVLELKLGHGFALMIGVALGALGIFYLAQGLSYSPSPITDVTDLELFLVVVAGVLAGLYFRWIIGPLIRRSKLTGPEALIGKIGIALTDLKPDGEVRVLGVVWRAKSVSGNIQKGESVKVIALKNLALTVEKISAEVPTS
jgi:membrane-bound serine protease (ClpP class)